MGSRREGQNLQLKSVHERCSHGEKSHGDGPNLTRKGMEYE